MAGKYSIKPLQRRREQPTFPACQRMFGSYAAEVCSQFKDNRNFQLTYRDAFAYTERNNKSNWLILSYFFFKT